jgi:carboxyl-terminal processing protease
MSATEGMLHPPPCLGTPNLTVRIEGAGAGFWSYDATGHLVRRSWRQGQPDGTTIILDATFTFTGDRWTEVLVKLPDEGVQRLVRRFEGRRLVSAELYVNALPAPVRTATYKYETNKITCSLKGEFGSFVMVYEFEGDRVIKRTSPGAVYTYMYDVEGRLAVTKLTGRIRSTWTYAYGGGGRLSYVTIDRAEGQMRFDYEYRDDGRVKSIRAKGWAPELLTHLSLTWDGEHRIAALTETFDRQGRARMDVVTFAYGTDPVKDDGSLLAKVTAGEIAMQVCELVEELHFSRTKANDAIGKLTMELFVKSLDPRRDIFWGGDYVRFQELDKQIDDLICSGDVAVAFELHRTLLARLEARAAMASAFLRDDANWTASALEGTVILEGEHTAPPTSVAEANERYRTYLRYRVAVLVRRSKPDTLEEEMQQARAVLAAETQLQLQGARNAGELEQLEPLLTAFTGAFDPYTVWMTPSDGRRFITATTLELTGVGVQVAPHEKGAKIEGILPRGPAERSGLLKPQDVIVGVDDGHGKMLKASTLTLDQLTEKILGPRGSKVRIRIERMGKDVGEIELIRDRIVIEEARAKGEVIYFRGRRILIVKPGSFYGSRTEEGEIGQSVTADVRAIIAEKRANPGFDVVVMDLRGNGGGLLDEAAALAGLFIETGPVAQRAGPERPVKGRPVNDPSPDAFCTEPLAVWLDRHSASASEIFGAAIKDYNRGILFGDETTYGKGSVQNPAPVNPNDKRYGLLKITVEKFYRVTGETTGRNGVTQQIVVPSANDTDRDSESRRKTALASDKIDKLPFKPANAIPDEVLNRLKTSAAGRYNSEFFQRQLKRREARRKAAAAGTEIFTLALLRERAAEEDQDRSSALPARGSGTPAVLYSLEDPYVKEACQIAYDLAEALRPIELPVNVFAH